MHTHLPEIIKLIKQKNNILIHCQAGKHRTGFMAYTLLRIFRFDDLESQEIIKKCRIEAFEGLHD